MKFCEFDADAGAKTNGEAKGNSLLMQMIDDVNSQSATRNKNLESKGYGYLPLKTVVTNQTAFYDKKLK